MAEEPYLILNTVAQRSHCFSTYVNVLIPLGASELMQSCIIYPRA